MYKRFSSILLALRADLDGEEDAVAESGRWMVGGDAARLLLAAAEA